jgi:argininosuccinate lyase
LYATDLADYLVLKGVSFRSAHEAIGKLVRYSLSENIKIKEMSEPELKKFSSHFVKSEVIKRLDPLFSVKSKKSITRK